MSQTPVSTSAAPGAAEAVPAPDASSVEAQRQNAVHRLALAHQSNPALYRAQARARVDLAAAILAMDDAAAVPGRHNLNEQLAVENALTAYGQALANLLRGEDPDA